MKKKIIIFIIPVLLLVICYLSIRIFISFKKGYSVEEMDWDQNGKTSFSEILSASDIGKRTIIKDGSGCVEYYSFKDGLMVKIVCPK
jgi:hypothetical protein